MKVEFKKSVEIVIPEGWEKIHHSEMKVNHPDYLCVGVHIDGKSPRSDWQELGNSGFVRGNIPIAWKYTFIRRKQIFKEIHFPLYSCRVYAGGITLKMTHVEAREVIAKLKKEFSLED